MDRRLDDLVRSERHFTSGLLLHLLLFDHLRGVDLLLDLLVARGVLAERPVGKASDDPRTQVIAELAVRRDLVKSGATVEEGAPRDVIDVVLVVGEVLIAIEAKFFTRPPASEIRSQLETQRRALDSVLADPAFGVARVVQVFLEHGRTLEPAAIGCEGVLSWADVLDLAHALPGHDSYVATRLRAAVARCEAELVPGGQGERPWQGEMTFDEVVSLCEAEGDRVFVGYDSRKAKLKDKTLSELRRRTWKWCWFSDPGRRQKRNWIAGDQFLRDLAAMGVR
jgi:hypothetical protein